MAETNTQTLFATPDANQTASVVNNSLASSPLSGGTGLGLDMSQNEKDAIMRQIHPIFLTTHSEEKVPVHESNFDKFLGFMRLCLEGLLKLVDIVVDAIIQIARLGVWIVAISGVLIVVTLMTNTTDKFIDLLNESVFKAFGWETRIAKVPATTNDTTKDTQIKSDALAPTLETDSSSTSDTITTDTANTNTGSTRIRKTASHHRCFSYHRYCYSII